MSKTGVTRHDPVPIGEVSAPPFVRLPDPSTLFYARAERAKRLSLTHELGPYLNFLSALFFAQHQIQDGLGAPDVPAADALARAREFGMPPLDRNKFVTEPVFETTLDRLLALADGIDMPPAARDALTKVRGADAVARDGMVRAVLADSIPVETMAEHAYVAAALQVHFARVASGLDGDTLVAVGDGACPVCGGPPVASEVAGEQGMHGARFCTCALCATRWNYVRIKCTVCGSTEGIGYRSVEGADKDVQAEVCDTCHSYVKILHRQTNPALEPVVDDIATLALDLLVREQGYRRGAFNPFLLGY